MAELDRACCDYPDAVTGIVTAEKLAELANKNQHESTLRNAILVESIQGLPDIKMMQAESRFRNNGTAMWRLLRNREFKPEKSLMGW